jgi:hypothetical protein
MSRYGATGSASDLRASSASGSAAGAVVPKAPRRPTPSASRTTVPVPTTAAPRHDHTVRQCTSALPHIGCAPAACTVTLPRGAPVESATST